MAEADGGNIEVEEKKEPDPATTVENGVVDAPPTEAVAEQANQEPKSFGTKLN